MSLASIKTALYTWFRDESDLTVIWSRQGTPRPPYPYGEIRYVGAPTREGAVDETQYDEEDDDFKTVARRTSLCSLNIYGPNANDIMGRVLASLDRSDIIEFFSSAGIAHFGENGPNDLTELQDTSYPERSQMDISIRFLDVHDDTDAAIEEVTIGMEFELSEDELNETFTVIRVDPTDDED